VRLDGVVGAGQAGDGVKQYYRVALVLDHALGFFDHISATCTWRPAVRQSGADDLGADAASLHVGDFLGAFVIKRMKR